MSATIIARVAARKEADAILELIAEIVNRWPDSEKDARRHFLEIIDATVHGVLFPVAVAKPVVPVRKVASERQIGELPPDAQRALKIVDEIESLTDEVPEAAEDFATDVLQKSISIGMTIMRANSVTANQSSALENMRDGLARWIRD